MILRKSGFTIVELVVVITIIMILASAVLVLTNSAKQKSRDARRMEDVGQIQTALNIYFADERKFPILTTQTNITGSDAFSLALTNANTIEVLPLDPLFPSYSYTYVSNADGSTYTLGFCLETDTVQRFAQGCSNTITP